MAANARPFTLAPLHEYRFELDPAESMALRLVDGTAELFGLELATGQDYPFGDEARGAVFTWHGATLEMSRLLPSLQCIDSHPLGRRCAVPMPRACSLPG